MKYVVEVMYRDHNEWSDEMEEYCDALNNAREMSELAGVSEARVWYDEEIIDIAVDGIVQGECEEWNEWDDEEPCDDWDEVGYDPYTGGYDMDL